MSSIYPSRFILPPPEERESLSATLAAIGRTRRSQLIVRSLCQLLILLLIPLLLVTAADALWSLPSWARALSLIGILTACGLQVRQRLLPAWRAPTDPLAVALELENRYPELHDTLATAATLARQMERQNMPAMPGRLAAAVIRAGHRLLERSHFHDHLTISGLLRDCFAAMVLVMVGAIITLVDSRTATIALARLLNPYGGYSWPTQTRLEILEPTHLPRRIARGESWELTVRVSGVVPPQAVLEIQSLSGEEQFVETYALSTADDRREAEPILRVRFDGRRLTQPYRWRLTANDAQTGWHNVMVVIPPQFVSLHGRPSPQFHVQPPAYTAIPPHDLPDAAAAVEIPAGSVLMIRAATDEPLLAAQIEYAGPLPPTELLAPFQFLHIGDPWMAAPAFALSANIAAATPVQIAPDGRRLSATFQPAFSGTYTWKLTDTQGVTSTRYLDIRLIPDPLPAVTVSRPSEAHDPPMYLPTARIPLQAVVQDTLYGLRQVGVEYRWNHEPLQYLSLWTLPKQPGIAAAIGGLGYLPPPRQVRVEQTVPLDAFRRTDGREPQPGDVLWLRLAAWDNDVITPCKPPGRSQVSQSSMTGSEVWDFVLTIASVEQLQHRLQRELAELLPELRRLRDQQREALEHSLGLPSQLPEHYRPPERERWSRMTLLQRQVRQGTEDRPNGILPRVIRLNRMIRANPLPATSLAQRCSWLQSELERLVQDPLPAAEALIHQLGNLASRPPMSPPQAEDTWHELRRRQKAILDVFNELIDWADAAGDAAAIRNEAIILRQQAVAQSQELNRLATEAAGRLTATQQQAADRLHTMTEQTASGVSQLLSRTARHIHQKEANAQQRRRMAEEALAQAARLQERAETLPPGSSERSLMQAQAFRLQSQAHDERNTAEQLLKQADLLRHALRAAEGQSASELLRRSVAAIRRQQWSLAAEQQHNAATLLGQLIDALSQSESSAAPELGKLRHAADGLDALAAAQDALGRRIEQALRLGDPTERAAALQRLAREQERIVDEARQHLHRLSRQDAELASQIQEAIEVMEAVRNDLLQGQPPAETQRTVERLDDVRDQLDRKVIQSSPQQLANETDRKLLERLRSLHARQQSRLAEIRRLHARRDAAGRWERSVLQSYAALADDEQLLASELLPLSKELEMTPVLQYLLDETHRQVRRAGERITERIEEIDTALPYDAAFEQDHDRRVLQPMETSLRRLELLIRAMDPPAAASEPKSRRPNHRAAISPEKSQLQVLRELQAELNQRTAELAQRHPDPQSWDDAVREEVQELEAVQRDIARLIEKLMPQPTDPQPPAADPRQPQGSAPSPARQSQSLLSPQRMPGFPNREMGVIAQ